MAVPQLSGELAPARVRERLELAAEARFDASWSSIAALILYVFSPFLLILSLTMGVVPLVIFLAGFGGVLLIGRRGRRLNVEGRRAQDALVQQLLQWETTLPFPLDGWRDWLVSDRPELEVETKAPADVPALTAAAHAIDSRIVVEKVDKRTVKMVIPPRAHAFSSSSPIVHYGDRKLAMALVEQVLVPLHAKTGVVAVHMGGPIEVLPTRSGRGS